MAYRVTRTNTAGVAARRAASAGTCATNHARCWTVNFALKTPRAFVCT